MAAEPEEDEHKTGRRQDTGIGEEESVTTRKTETEPSPKRESYSASERIPSSGAMSARLEKSETLGPYPGYPREISLPPVSKGEPTRTEHVGHDRNEEFRPARATQDVSEDTHQATAHEQSRTDNVRETGRLPTDANRKEVVSLFVRNVAKHVMEQQLVDLFSKYGPVDSAVVVRDPHSKECRGFGFVSMDTDEGARAAIAALQDVDFQGRRISVERAKRSEPHSRTPGAYMGIDRRIRERYAGMKRHRDYEMDRYQPYPLHYDMKGGSYRDRHHDQSRPRLDERPWDHRTSHGNQQFYERSRIRRRYNADGPASLPPRSFDRNHRFRERDPPVPRESADDYI